MIAAKCHAFIISNKYTELDGVAGEPEASAGKDELRICAAEIGRSYDAAHKANFSRFSRAHSNLD
jgi:hypothetical protein